MNKVKKNLCLLLAVLTAGLAASCKADNGNTKGKDTVEDKKEHTIEGTLHNISITENDSRVFVKNKKSDYVILADNDGEAMQTAVDLITKNVTSATGAVIKSRVYSDGEESSWTQNDKLIVFDNDAYFEKSGLTMPADDLGSGGYYIKTLGNTVFIMCAEASGYQLGAIKFLEATLGYDMLSADCVVYEKSGESIPDMEITEKPDYEYRMSSTFKMSSSAVYGMGFNQPTLESLFMPVPNRATGTSGITMHNSYNYLPPSMYNDESNAESYHPKWYSYPSNEQKQQLCYTAHGDADEYKAMVDTLYVYLKEIVDANPTMHNITITHQDNYSYCDCDACMEVVSNYGAISAAYIMFLNDVDDKLQADLEKEAKASGEEKREVNILFFAYHGTKESPTTLGEDGKYHAVSDDVIMNEHVGVMIAPIESYYTSTFYDEINAEKGEAELIKSWSCLTDKVYMWTYNTYFTSYFYPYNSWGTMVENYRFCLENHAIYMFNQGQHDQNSPTAFMALKYYVDSKAGINVNVNYSELEAKFFRYYFKEAAELMYAFFNEVQAKLTYLEKTYSDEISGTIDNNLTTNTLAKRKYWSYRTLTGYLAYIDEAMEAISAYKTQEPSTYTMLKDHITAESLFPRYVLITLYGEQMSSNQLDEMKKSFVEDCNALGVNREKESEAISNLFSRWGY